MSKRSRRPPMGPVLLGTATAVMGGLLVYALLVTEPPVEYVVGLMAAAAVTGWAALECLRYDWANGGGDGHQRRRPPPSPSGKSGGPADGRVEVGGQAPVPAEPVQPTRLLADDATEPSAQESVPSLFRRPSNR